MTKVLHKKDIYVVNDASTYGVGLANAFAKQARKDGATVIDRLVPRHHPVQRRNREPHAVPGDAATVVSKKVGMLFYGGYYCDLGLLLGALHHAGYKGKVMSGDGSDSTALISGTNPHSAANGVYATCGVLSPRQQQG